MIQHSGQQEENFRALAATLTVHAGQVVVVGAVPGKRGSLGHFLFTAVEPDSDREIQKFLFLWASRSEDAPTDMTPPALVPADPAELAEPARRASARAAKSATPPAANPTH